MWSGITATPLSWPILELTIKLLFGIWPSREIGIRKQTNQTIQSGTISFIVCCSFVKDCKTSTRFIGISVMAKGKHKPAPGAVRPDKVLHPQSRKVSKLHKQESRKIKLSGNKSVGGQRLQALGEKLLWFHDNLLVAFEAIEDTSEKVVTKKLMLEIMEAYLARFKEELEQIRIKNSIGKNRNQHRSRLDLIQDTMKLEKDEFEGCGLEAPDLFDAENLKYFLDWNGELRFIQNIKVKRINRKFLSSSKEETNEVMET